MFLKGLQTNRHGKRNLIMKINEKHIANKYFTWSILGGLLHACQIVIHSDVLLFELTGDITICRLYQGLRFHTQREDGANPTSLRPTKRNRSTTPQQVYSSP